MSTIAPLVAQMQLDTSPYKSALDDVMAPTNAVTQAIQAGSQALEQMAQQQNAVVQAAHGMVDVAALTDAQRDALASYLETGQAVPGFLAEMAAGQDAAAAAGAENTAALEQATAAAQGAGDAISGMAGGVGDGTAATERLNDALGQLDQEAASAGGNLGTVGDEAAGAASGFDELGQNAEGSAGHVHHHKEATDEAGESVNELKEKILEVTSGVLPGLGFGLQQAEGAWRALSSEEESANQRLAITGAGLTAIGVGIAGLSFEKFTSIAGGIQLTAQMTGLATDQLAGFQFAMESTGASTDRSTMALSRIQMQLQVVNEQMAAGAEPSGNLVKALGELGIKVTDDEGHIKTLSGLLPEIADRFKVLHDNATAGGAAFDATGLAMQLFSRTGATMVPVLEKGAEGLDEWTQKVRESGLASDAQIEKILAVRQSEAELDLAQKALTASLGAEMVPAFEKLAHAGLGALEALNQLPEPVKDLVVTVPLAAGGALLLAAGLGQLITMATPVIGALSGIGAAAGGLNAVEGAMMGLAAAEGALGAATTGFMAVMAMNPIFWLALAAAVLVAVSAFEVLHSAHDRVAASAERVSSAEKAWLDAAEQSRASTGNYKDALAALSAEHDVLAERLMSEASLTGNTSAAWLKDREALEANEAATTDLTGKQSELEAVQAKLAQTTQHGEQEYSNFAGALKNATTNVKDQGVELRAILDLLEKFPEDAREATEALVTMGQKPTSEEIELNRQTSAFKATVADLKVELADTGPSGQFIAGLQEQYDKMVQSGEKAKDLAAAHQYIADVIKGQSDPAAAENVRSIQQQIDEGDTAIKNLGLQADAVRAHRQAIVDDGTAAATTAPDLAELGAAMDKAVAHLNEGGEGIEHDLGEHLESASTHGHEQAVEVGLNIDHGLAEGIEAGKGEVGQATQHVVQHALDMANATAETQSPSRKTHKTGIDITVGLAEGIKQEQAQAEGAVHQVTTAVTAAATKGAAAAAKAAADVTKTAIAGFEHELVSSQSYYEGLVGKVGAGVMSALATAVNDNSAGAGQSVGRALQQIADQMQAAKIGDWQEQANELAGLLHDALINRTPESVAAAAEMVRHIDDELMAAKLWKTFAADATSASNSINQAMQTTAEAIESRYVSAGEQIKAALQSAADTSALEATRITIDNLAKDYALLSADQEQAQQRIAAAEQERQQRADQTAATAVQQARSLADLESGQAQSIVDLRAGHLQRLGDIHRTQQGAAAQAAEQAEDLQYRRSLTNLDDQTARQLLSLQRQAQRADEDRQLANAIADRDRAEGLLRQDEATARARAQAAAEITFKTDLETSFGVRQDQVQAAQTAQRISDIERQTNLQVDADNLHLRQTELAGAVAFRDKIRTLALDDPSGSLDAASRLAEGAVQVAGAFVNQAQQAMQGSTAEARSVFDNPANATLRISQVWTVDIPQALAAARAGADTTFAAMMAMSNQTLQNTRDTVAVLQQNVTTLQSANLASAGQVHAPQTPGTGGQTLTGQGVVSASTASGVGVPIPYTGNTGSFVAPPAAAAVPVTGGATALAPATGSAAAPATGSAGAAGTAAAAKPALHVTIQTQTGSTLADYLLTDSDFQNGEYTIIMDKLDKATKTKAAHGAYTGQH